MPICCNSVINIEFDSSEVHNIADSSSPSTSYTKINNIIHYYISFEVVVWRRNGLAHDRLSATVSDEEYANVDLWKSNDYFELGPQINSDYKVENLFFNLDKGISTIKTLTRKNTYGYEPYNFRII